jgi:hypothetical protein
MGVGAAIRPRAWINSTGSTARTRVEAAQLGTERSQRDRAAIRRRPRKVKKLFVFWRALWQA